MKQFYNRYLNNKVKLDKTQKLSVFFLVVAFSGVFGWLYEFIFYYFNDGRFSFQGGNFLPWINIYAIGSILIFLSSYKFKKHPYLVFILSGIVTGVLEYFAGWLIYVTNNGARYWDYNTEILNLGNISGFVCLRSVFIFSMCGLFLIYAILAFFMHIATKVNKKRLFVISLIIFSIFLIDEFYNDFTKVVNLPRANDIYYSWGWKNKLE